MSGASVALLVGLGKVVALPQHARVELVDEDAVIGILGRHGRSHLPIEVAHPLHH